MRSVIAQIHRYFKAYLFIVFIVLLHGCGNGSRAVNVPTYPLPAELGGIDISYIPYEYAEDGCWVRAPFLGMELAAHNIPSAAISVQTCNGNFGLNGPEGVSWKYHVTIVIRHDGALKVIDPMLSDRLLTKDEWLDAIDADDDAKVSINSAAYPTGSIDLACGSYSGEEEYIVDSVDEMTPFLLDNVMIYCAYMRQYLHESGKDTAAREERLILRTRELVMQLYEIGLIELWEESEDWQKLQEGPYCPDPIEGP